MPDQTSIGRLWHLACLSAKNHAALMASRCRREAASLIHRETNAFCDREVPTTKADLNRRQQQATFLMSRIGSISHADLMARNHPAVADQIMAAVRAFLHSVPIDQSPHNKAMVLISTISTICHSDMMQGTQ